jgi:hypothetical protein
MAWSGIESDYGSVVVLVEIDQLQSLPLGNAGIDSKSS